MNGFYQGKASVLRVTSQTKNDIGEITPVYTETSKVAIRISASTSQYIRTEVGYVKANQYIGLVKAKADIKQGDQVSWKNETYSVVSADDDGSGVFLKLTLELI